MAYLFKERLNEIMTDRKITQQMLAKAIGIKRETVSSYQTGRTDPGADILYKIADYLEVPADYLLGRDFDLTDRTKGIISEEYTGLSYENIETLHAIVTYRAALASKDEVDQALMAFYKRQLANVIQEAVFELAKESVK